MPTAYARRRHTHTSGGRREAGRGQAVVPWADQAPNPQLVRWAEGRDGHGRDAMVVGCGLGDDAEHLARHGYTVTAFDIAPTAVETARTRFPGSAVRYVAADLLAAPFSWRGAFDLVFEAYTVQVLLGDLRAQAIRAVGDLVAPCGTLLVVARARDESDPPGQMPWPLTRADVDSFGTAGLQPVTVEDLLDDEIPPVRRWVAEFHAVDQRKQGTGPAPSSYRT
jgi:SAM-dependent methyltransferase